MQKQEKEVLEKTLENSNKKLITFLSVAIILVIVAISGLLLYTYLQTPEHKLSLGANIEEVKLSSEKDVVYIKLSGESDKNITKIKFIFTDKNKNEYNYETSEGASEISVPFKRTFWQWLFKKPVYEGNYDYEINASELGLESFRDIAVVNVLFEYKTATGEPTEILPPDTEEPSHPSSTAGGGGGGGGGNGDNGQNPEPCADDTGCTKEGGFCEGNAPYDCFLGADGCLDRIDKAGCGAGYYCEDGKCVAGCINECNTIGDNFCYGNTPYSCVLGNDTCLDRILRQSCGFGEVCFNGSCIEETVPNMILYQDNFEDGNYNETDPNLNNSLSWEVVSGGAGVLDRITNKSLGLMNQNTTIISQQIIGYTEFTIEFDLNLIWSHAGRVLFLYNDKDNYYFFGINGNKLGLYRVMDGAEEQLDDGIYQYFFKLPHAGSASGRFKVYVKNDGNSIIFRFDKDGFSNGIDYESEVIDTNKFAVSRFTNGKIGFEETSNSFSSSFSIFLDNIIVYSGLKQNTRLRPIETFYVSPLGNDSNPGTQALPFKTIQKAAEVAQAGDTILIAPGIYEEGMIKPTYSGTKGYPITYKALDSNNKPALVGTVTFNSSQFSLYSGNIYKTVLDWKPDALYYGDIPLFVAQEPNQENPDDQMERKYFMNVSRENNDSTFESHYQLIDSSFFTQPDDFWTGATMLLYERAGNFIGSREIVDYVANKHMIILPYSPWEEIGDQDEYAIRNHLSILDKPGEYVIDKGKIEVLSWTENSGNLDVTIRKVSGAGNARAIRFFLINETSGLEIVNNTINLANSQTINFKINIAGKIQNLLMVYAVIELTDKYEVYVWPYTAQSLDEIAISKEDTAFNLGGTYSYHEYTIFDGIEIKHYQGTALDFSHSFGSNRNCIVRNSDIHHNMGSGVYARCDTTDKKCENDTIKSKCGGLVIEDSKLHHNYGQGASFGGGKNFTVQRCEIYENLDNGIWSGNGGNFLYAVCDVFIRNNYIHHQGSARTHPDNIQLYKTAYAIVDGNYLLQEGHQNTWFSYNGPLWFINNIVVNGPAGINSANESYIYNNVFYKSRVRLDAWQDDPLYWTEHSEIRNNIFIDEILSRPPEHLWKNLLIDHNFYSVEGGYYNSFNNIGFGEGSIINTNANSSDPTSLYNYFSELENFTLKLGSELIDAGYFLVPAETDRNRNRRFQGARPDIGATETFNSYSYEDCSNNIQDGNEQGVDCGGICEQDFDNDGYFIGLCSGQIDCNDSNSLINPGAQEICDVIDNNCDGQQHPDYYLDSDSDGINNCLDNCPSNVNPGQEDFDNDGIGDVCDSYTTYEDDFEDRFTGFTDLSEQKKQNGLSWELIKGNASVSLEDATKMLRISSTGESIVICEQGGDSWQNINISVDAGKYWSPTNTGLVFLYKDSANFYFLNIRNGALIKRGNNVDSVVGINSSIESGHHDNVLNNFKIEILVEGNLVKFKISKNNSNPVEFVDSNPSSTKGAIGFISNSSTLRADNVKVTISSQYSSPSLSPFAKIWNFFKSLLTAKTGNAITGNAVNDLENKEDKSLNKDSSFLIKIIKWFKNPLSST